MLEVTVGQRVVRYISSARVSMPLYVTAVEPTLIRCGNWTFDRQTGAEIDPALGWGERDAEGTIHTGSLIVVEP